MKRLFVYHKWSAPEAPPVAVILADGTVAQCESSAIESDIQAALEAEHLPIFAPMGYLNSPASHYALHSLEGFCVMFAVLTDRGYRVRTEGYRQRPAPAQAG